MGLCLLFGWLPGQAEAEDWATLAELQERIEEQRERDEYERWKGSLRKSWQHGIA